MNNCIFSTKTIVEAILKGKFDSTFKTLYKNDAVVVAKQKERYLAAIKEFVAVFGEREEISLFSAPGRTEIGGNHTDHNHGKVLAASVNLDVIAVAAKNSDNTVRVQSKGYNMDVVSLDMLEPIPKEINKSTSLVRGVCAKFVIENHLLGGFDAYTTSNVLKGSGLSSSAAYEVLVGTIINNFYNNAKVSAVSIAQYSQFAENVFFGKASGLLDQLTCAVGGFIAVDFADPSNPTIQKVDFDFAKSGYALCIVDTKGSHSDLSDDYSLIPSEMKAVATCFGKEFLRDVSPEIFREKIDMVREMAGDRAVLRAMHFFAENIRVEKEAQSLAHNDFEEFKKQIILSGDSSYKFLQNVYTNSHPDRQGLSVALCIAQDILGDCGAYRVHGGGFAGTIQAFVPSKKVADFSSEMDKIFGVGSCHILSVRPVGGIILTATL